MDLIRELLLKMEADERLDGTRSIQFHSPDEMGFSDHSAKEVGYNLNLLIEAGYLLGTSKPDIEQIPRIRRLTWQGHEFIANIQNDDIWSRTKARIAGLSHVALPIIAAIAESEVKQKLGLH
jgi:hypothetical protein